MNNVNDDIEVTMVSANSNIERRLFEYLVRDPSIHSFTLNDIRRERRKTTLYVALSGDDIYGYMLIYMVHRGYRSAILEVFNKGLEKAVIRKLLVHSNVDKNSFRGTLHIDRRFLTVIGALIKPTTTYNYYIMEYSDPSPQCEVKGELTFVEINEQNIIEYGSTYEVVRRARGLRKAYGVILNSRIVGIGGFYVMEPEVYLIGGIYVEPRYRGKGIGKSLSCFLTRRALKETSRATLWVNTENKPAIHIYRDIGYRVIRTNAWVNINVNVKP